MNCAPSFQQYRLLLFYHPHGAPKIGAGHAT
jgi:hypothetical protein